MPLPLAAASLAPGLTLAMTGIVKTFPGVRALDAADLDIRAGEIHGLVGENGAGKSTIIKILGGVYARDAGDILANGEVLAGGAAADMHAIGIRIIHQELNLVDHFTVAESVFLGQERTDRFGGLAKRRMRREAEAFLRDVLECPLDGQTLIRDLGIAERKLVQIAAALIDGKARLVVFDEPTAPLAAAETGRLFNAIRNLKARGVSILYVSHYLGEIVDICDRVTVFRNGRHVAVLDAPNPTRTDEIITWMIGRQLDDLYPAAAVRTADGIEAEPSFAVERLGDGRSFADVSFSLAKGEIFGIAGLIGSGRDELVDGLYGLRPPATGRVTRAGRPIRLDPALAVQSGLVLVPRDRRRDGLVLDLAVTDNINLASLDEVSTAGFRRERRANARATRLADLLDIRPRSVGTRAGLLSGGNQQKVVLGRWLAAEAEIFLLDEPTIGVDIGARAEIYRLVRELADGGATVIVSSGDAAELIGLCDRIAVLVRGKLVEIVRCGEISVDGLIARTTDAAGQRVAS
ncbi:sugar ABC transporter ATP-binding protein [Kaistia terrae]|uniref:Sugar ABC transporter ATP-binding protein n=1 Tax=Kaistia terrae TaxID=537017 RepID=A0ABW0PU02_9HYPH|nr:sugar ABC transporter ATP-binding protein [Kaistia terrae]MCX5577174.1 sugar ABC transporter ATP-binding protein [Kaistia terrae]